MKPDAPIHKGYGGTYFWSTESEEAFLDGIGTFTKEIRSGGFSLQGRKLKCLLGYREGFFKRVNWGKIDPLEILNYLREKIMEAQYGGGKEKKIVERKEETDGKSKDSGPGWQGDPTTEQGESGSPVDTGNNGDRAN
jgi:hypothetical protein